MSSVPPDDPRKRLGEDSDEALQQVHADLLKNKPEPKEGYSVTPLFLLGLLSSLVFVGSIYLVHYRGGFSPLVYDERFDPKKAAGATQTVQIDPVAAGKRLFNQPGMCATCHQPTGMGVPGVFPPLAGAEWVTGSEERVIRILLHGMTGEVRVKGNVYNGAMPAFGVGSGYNWNDERISQVLTYIRQEWGNAAPAITAARVTEIRTQGAAGRTTPWTAKELEALP
jgi:mono/diheme cytochrome c family protein